MRRILAVVLMLIMLCGVLSACGKNVELNNNGSTNPPNTDTPTGVSSQTPTIPDGLKEIPS